MAGHSKWNNIKNRKAAVDAKKGKIYSKLARLIRTCVKETDNPDSETNPSLRLLMDKARDANMPKDKIQRAIDAGLGKLKDGRQLEEVIYEGFGPGGVGILIVCVTDNRNRTSSELRFLLEKYQGSLGGPNTVMYMFTRDKEGEYKCKMPIPVSDSDKPNLIKLIEDLRENDDVEDVYPATNDIDQD